MSDGSTDILLVEDNPGDVRLTKEALAECEAASALHVVEDGVEALAFCRQHDEYADAPTPDVILLDLSLPRKDGRELLEEFTGDPELRPIPIVVFSSSDSRTDIRDAYEQCANAYLAKPTDPEAFIGMVQTFAAFWLDTVRLLDTGE